ncbi:hypothetical protein J6590_028985 [Homalodisca vitripennis]|nr:hypothetical protein J6590_028985 [Homalodisca vitripennis]
MSVELMECFVTKELWTPDRTASPHPAIQHCWIGWSSLSIRICGLGVQELNNHGQP